MESFDLYKDMQARTGGELYIGVAGPVRSGKSTFIRRFMEQIVLPHVDPSKVPSMTDELPVSGSGKTVTTVEPKFIPNQAIQIDLVKGIRAAIRLIDCIGYVIEGAAGLDDHGEMRMVKTPWFSKPVPFIQAAEVGTDKVIRDHATVGILLTSDGTTGDFSRETYVAAEKKTYDAMKKSGKPFVIVLNSQKPHSKETQKLQDSLEETYHTAVVSVNCEQLKENDVDQIFEKLLYEFPVTCMEYFLPGWVETLPEGHPLKQEIFQAVRDSFSNIRSMKDAKSDTMLPHSDHISRAYAEDITLSDGCIRLRLELPESCYYGMLSEMAGIEIEGEYQLIDMLKDLTTHKALYEQIAGSMEMVRQTGYGVLKPEKEEIQLAAPQIIKQGNRYGVKIHAESPSIHLIRAQIETEIAPIVGTEQQAKDLITYIEQNIKEDGSIWNVNIFGKTVSQLVEDGIETKLSIMGEECKQKLQETMKKIVNESNGKIICIIL